MNDVTVLTHFTPSILIISKITSIREVSTSNKKKFNQQSTKTLVNYVLPIFKLDTFHQLITKSVVAIC